MTPPFITVLINTHNYGQFIEEAIDSVLSQDFPLDQFEILVVDDGSTDDTPQRVKKYGARVRYLYKQNGGQASALNLGITSARGEIVVLLDADDLFLPGRLAHVGRAFQENPNLGMVYHPYLEWNVQTGERHQSALPLVSGDARVAADPFSEYITYLTSAIALRRSSLGPLLPIPDRIRMIADCFLVQLIPLLAPILALSEPLVIYRIHGGNQGAHCSGDGSVYYADPQQMLLEKRKSSLRQWKILFEAMREWVRKNGYNMRQAPLLYFAIRWYQHEKMEEFRVNPPGRLRFFWFLAKENYLYSPKQTWKLTLFNYLWAFWGLGLGFKKAAFVYKWRAKVLEATERIFKRRVRAALG